MEAVHTDYTTTLSDARAVPNVAQAISMWTLSRRLISFAEESHSIASLYASNVGAKSRPQTLAQELGR